jgi:hypothetical protein
VLSTFLSIGVPFFWQGNFRLGRKASEEDSGNAGLDGTAGDDAGKASFAKHAAAGNSAEHDWFEHGEVTPQQAPEAQQERAPQNA